MQALGYLAIFAGALVLISGVTGSTITSVAKGAPDHARAVNPSAGVTGSAQAGESAASTAGAAHSATSSPFGTAPSPQSVGAGVGSSHSKMVMQAYVRAYAKNLHWNASDWEAVIDRESGWNPSATNASTGAYGLGQFNPEGSISHPRPGSAAALYAHAGATSPDWRAQVHAMALYIYTRYGNPTNALAHEHSAGWY